MERPMMRSRFRTALLLLLASVAVAGSALADDDQTPADLHWIREPFLSHGESHGCVVVHGHTITDQPELRANRIGIDTGAYRTGCLTALGLQGETRWLIEARDENGAVRVSQRSL